MNTKAARQRGEEAGNRAVARTERDVPDWSEQALHYARWYARICKTSWTGEHFRLWAESKGLPLPKDARSYGPIIAKSIRDGVIERVGFAPTVSSRGSARATYRRAGYGVL